MMLKAALVIVLLGCLTFPSVARRLITEGIPYPHVVLNNGLLRVSVLLPDAQQGFYRAQRFEWSGMTWQLTYQGHTFFGPVQQVHNPEDRHHARGLAEEFGFGTDFAPATGWEEAAPGEPFLKIGVGLEEKDEVEIYRFGHPYEMINTFDWEVRWGLTWIRFTQQVKDFNGYGYHYTKRMYLTPGQPELVVSHYLKNLGTKPLDTNQYAHNFFILDGEPIGPAYQVELGFPAQAMRELPDTTSVEGRFINFHKSLAGESPVFTELSGYSDSPADNVFVLRNLDTGAQVEARGDFSLLAFNFYAQAEAICPEPFIQIQLAPGETKQWQHTYRFSVAE